MNNDLDNPKNARKGIFVITIVLMLVATLSVVMTMFSSIEAMGFAYVDAGFDELALLVLIPAALLFALLGVLVSIVTLILSVRIRKRYVGGEKIFGLVSLIISSIYILLSVVFPILMLVILK